MGLDPVSWALPKTGICIQFDPSNGLNPDGSTTEEVGTIPDIPIEEGEDALERCLAEIRK